MLSPSSEPFATMLSRQESGLRYHYLPIPPGIADAYAEQGIRRVIATVNGVPIRRGMQRTADGEHFVVVNGDMMRTFGAGVGDIVTVELAPDPEPDHIDMAIEFVEVLEMDEEVAARFYSFSPGKQRGLALYVSSAKREETRIKRALELAYKLRTYTLYGDRMKEG
ncbi:MAG: DUF1905 domain-containing protein [Planctomycetales bacterium]|nr:DUF1905 domain-containing protein [Planctomycetales bacterium]